MYDLSEKAGYPKIQSIFQKIAKNRDIKDFKRHILRKSGAVLLKRTAFL
jgi:hypothetical protein